MSEDRDKGNESQEGNSEIKWDIRFLISMVLGSNEEVWKLLYSTPLIDLIS
jgi:hypothetical protein